MKTPKLSSAKINPTKLLPGTSISEKKISTQKLQEESISLLKSDLFIIKKQVFKVRDLIQTSTLIKQSELEKKRKSTEKKGAEEQENKLEAKPEKKEGKLKMPSVPKLGFLDRIKNFLFSVLLGYISIKLLPHLPKLVGIVSIIGNVMEFMIDLGGNILDKVVTFIDWGYKAIDATRGFMKSFGGDFSLKIFDTFTGAVSGVIDAAIIASIALSAMSGGDGGGGPGGGKPRVGGKGAGRVDPRAARKYAERFGRDAALKKFGKEGLGKLGGKYARSGATNLARKGLVGLAGKGGAKAVLGFAKPFLKRLPIIGALIDFGLSVALGEDPGRAAFKAIGAGLLGFVGAAVGSVVPIAGNLVGGILGGIAGDALGGALYDMFFGGKKPKAQKSQAVKAAGGGPAPVTRGNKIVGGAVKRTISRRPVKRGVKVQVTKVKPGGSIGGKKKIEKIFPEVPIKDKGKDVNPLGYMQSSYNIATKTPSFGALFALPLKAQLGEKPSSVDYMKAAEELTGWMQNTFRGTAGYAGGGKVEAGMFGGEDTTNVIAKSLEETISSKVDAAIKELQKQLMLKEGEKETGQKKTGSDGGAMGTGEYSPEGLQGEIYQYLLSKGLDDTHALGLMANISRESGFRPGVASGDDGGAGGLFQWKIPRSNNMSKAVPDWKTNWKGQIDYALKEPGEPGPQWIAMKFSSSQEAADWWMSEWERPGDKIGGSQKHKEYIASLEKYRTKKGTLDFPKGVDLGTGYGAAGGKIAGELGRYLNQNLVPGKDFLRVTEHPEHGGVLGKHATNSYHYQGRAIDIGAFADEQPKILRAISQFNQKKGVKPVELLKAGDAGHSDHVHIAYAKGGETKPYAHIATLGEKGIETVIDADSTKGLASLAPNLLKKLNTAETKPQLMKILQSYMGGSTQISANYGGMIKKPSLAIIAEKGKEEFLLGGRTTELFNSLGPNLLEKINTAKTKPQLADILLSATYGGAAAERQQKIDAFMNQKGMPAGKGFQGRFDMFGREYDTNTGKLKQANAVKELNNMQISQQMSSLLQLTGILQSYAGYEDGAEQTVIVMNNPQMVPIPIPTGNSGSIGGMSRSHIDTTYDIQYANA